MKRSIGLAAKKGLAAIVIEVDIGLFKLDTIKVITR